MDEITELQDRLALLDREGEYARRYDSQDGKAWAALFVEDGVYQGRRLAGMPPQNVVRGRAALEAFCASQKMSGMHTMHVPHIELDGGAARVRVHFHFEASGTDEYRRVHTRTAAGFYDVAYVKHDGTWLIERRVTTYLSLEQKTHYPYEVEDFDFSSPVPDEPVDAR